MTSRTRVCFTAGLLLLLVFALGGACSESNTDPEVTGPRYSIIEELHGDQLTKIDILFVVDNSNSMSEEQEVLSEQIVLLAHELTSPTERGWETSVAAEDLHLGVISSDLGVGGHNIQTCTDSEDGDAGILQNVGRLDHCEEEYWAPDCEEESCPWLVHSSQYPDNDEGSSNPPIWEDFGCIATLGTGGCGFEQQLESARVALVDLTAPGEPNEGFLRDDSLIAIFFITDEDDCSAADADFFDPDEADREPLNVRCATESGELHPVSRYVDAFLGLREDNPDRVVVGAITGVPVDGSWNPGDSLEGLRELQQVNPDSDNELVASCRTPMGTAYPPVRIAELVYGFGNNGLLESICREDWSAALQAVTRKLQKKLSGSCIGRSLPRDIERCRVVETLSDDRECPHPVEPTGAGQERTGGMHVDLGLMEDVLGTTRRQCEILPADYDMGGCPDGAQDCSEDDFTGALLGWFHDRDDPDCEHGQIRFSDPFLVDPTSEVRYECLEDGVEGEQDS